MLLKRLMIKTSATNQLFGIITAMQTGAFNGEVLVSGIERWLADYSCAGFDGAQITQSQLSTSARQKLHRLN